MAPGWRSLIWRQLESSHTFKKLTFQQCPLSGLLIKMVNWQYFLNNLVLKVEKGKTGFFLAITVLHYSTAVYHIQISIWCISLTWSMNFHTFVHKVAPDSGWYWQNQILLYYTIILNVLALWERLYAVKSFYTLQTDKKKITDIHILVIHSV